MYTRVKSFHHPRPGELVSIYFAGVSSSRSLSPAKQPPRLPRTKVAALVPYVAKPRPSELRSLARTPNPVQLSPKSHSRRLYTWRSLSKRGNDTSCLPSSHRHRNPSLSLLRYPSLRSPSPLPSHLPRSPSSPVSRGLPYPHHYAHGTTEQPTFSSQFCAHASMLGCLTAPHPRRRGYRD